MNGKITLTHGSGGKQMHEFINKNLISKLKNGILEKMDDCGIVENSPNAPKVAITTDSYVVNPLFFPGGDIGRLCIAGTINDLTTSGAKAIGLSLAFIIEEGVSIEEIDKIIDSIASTCKEADIKIITGDTKVVESGKGDKLYINTCGVGLITEDINLSTYNATEGDAVFITGPIGNHEVAMMKARKMIEFDIDVVSDVAPLNIETQKLLSQTKNIKCIKDPTRGGLVSALQEIADHSNCDIKLIEELIPIDKQVNGVCNLLGMDPLYMANEGKFIIISPESELQFIKQSFPNSAQIGKVIKPSKGQNNVLLENSFGGIRKLKMLENLQLPRIC